jgi:hypothetical protein
MNVCMYVCMYVCFMYVYVYIYICTGTEEASSKLNSNSKLGTVTLSINPQP